MCFKKERREKGTASANNDFYIGHKFIVHRCMLCKFIVVLFFYFIYLFLNEIKMKNHEFEPQTFYFLLFPIKKEEIIKNCKREHSKLHGRQ